MKSEAVQIAKIQASMRTQEHLMSLLKNPVLEIFLAYLLIETAQKVPIGSTTQDTVIDLPFLPPIKIGSKSVPQYLISDKAGTVAEGAILVAVALQQLAPLAPYYTQNLQSLMGGISDMAGIAGKVAPMLLAGA
jgi:hypothetical protein